VQIKYILLICFQLKLILGICQRNEVKLGSKSTNIKIEKEFNNSMFLKFYPTNLLRGDFSVGFEKAISRYFSVEPVVSTHFYNTIENRINDEADFSENSYYHRINYNKNNVKFLPSLGTKISLKYFEDEHYDLEGFYYSIGFAYMNTNIKQSVNFLPNNQRIININEFEYKIMRGSNIMSKRNRNFEFAFGVGIRQFIYDLEEVEEVINPINSSVSIKHQTTKINYLLPTFIFNLNIGFEIKKKVNRNHKNVNGI